MKKFLLLLFEITLATSSQAAGYTSNRSITTIDTATEHLLYRGSLVELYIEKSIFYSATSSNFLMKFTLKNTNDKPVGVDLTKYFKIVYPNQWGFSKTPYREVINEIQIIPDTAINKTELLTKFKDNLLTMIKPGETISYYRDWNGNGKKPETKNKEDFLIISIDGQLLVTNGESFEHITLNEADETKRVLVLNFPIVYKTLPGNVLVIKDK